MGNEFKPFQVVHHLCFVLTKKKKKLGSHIFFLNPKTLFKCRWCSCSDLHFFSLNCLSSITQCWQVPDVACSNKWPHFRVEKTWGLFAFQPFACNTD